jgi:hypothetical protein
MAINALAVSDEASGVEQGSKQDELVTGRVLLQLVGGIDLLLEGISSGTELYTATASVNSAGDGVTSLWSCSSSIGWGH